MTNHNPSSNPGVSDGSNLCDLRNVANRTTLLSGSADATLEVDNGGPGVFGSVERISFNHVGNNITLGSRVVGVYVGYCSPQTRYLSLKLSPAVYKR
jgi:hypothetical protein